MIREAKRKEDEKRQARIALIASSLSLSLGKLLNKKLARRKELKRIAATKIQKYVRRMLGRMKYFLLKKKNAAAIVIQCFYRIVLAKKRVKLYKKLNSAYQILKKRKIDRQKRCTNYIYNGASVVISRAYNGYKIRVRLKIVVSWNRLHN